MTDRWFRPPFFGNSNTERLNGKYSVGRGPGGVYNRFPREQSDIGRLDHDADVHENRSSHVLTVRVADRIHIKLILDPLEYVYGTWGVRAAARAALRYDKNIKHAPIFCGLAAPRWPQLEKQRTLHKNQTRRPMLSPTQNCFVFWNGRPNNKTNLNNVKFDDHPGLPRYGVRANGAQTNGSHNVPQTLPE